MVDEQQQADVHLAFRTEGQCFNAYLEWKGNAPFVQLVGSINQMVCADDPMMFETWRNLMTLAVCRFAERISGQRPQIVGQRTVPVGGSA